MRVIPTDDCKGLPIKRLFQVGLLVLILLPSLVSAFDLPPDFYMRWEMCEIDERGPMYTGHDWIVKSVTGIFLVGMIVIAVYMIGTALNVPSLVAWSKSESTQLLVSLLILFILIGLIPMLIEIGRTNNPTCAPPSCGTACGAADGGCTLMQTAQIYSFTMRNTFAKLTKQLLYLNVLYRMFGSGKYSIEVSEFFSVTSKIKTAMNPLSKVSDWITSLIGPSMISWVGIEFLLCFISKTALSVFLPLGIIFRSFPVTRSLGGGLMSFALVSYFVLPLLLNIDNVIVTAHYGLDPGQTVAYYRDIQSDPSKLFSEPTPFTEHIDVALDVVSNNLKSVLNLAVSSKFFIGSVICPASIGNMFALMYYYIVTLLLPDLAYLIVVATLGLLIFKIFIYFTLLKNLASFFGSDMSFESLMSLI